MKLLSVAKLLLLLIIAKTLMRFFAILVVLFVKK